MNMNFQRHRCLELQHASSRTMEPSADKPTTRKSWLKYTAWSLVALGASYFIVNASTPHRIVGGAIMALAGLATFVCLRAQNETPYW